MNCEYCFYRSASAQRKNNIMKKETVDLLIQKIKEHQPLSLNILFQGGEPSLSGLEFFEYFVSKVKENIFAPVSYGFQTNGLLIDDDFAKFFKENDFLVGISLDGNQNTNDRYRFDINKNSVFSRVLNAINTLKKYEVDFNILSVIDDENAKDIESTYSFFKSHGFDFLQFIPCVNEEGSIALSCENYEAFLKDIFDLWYEDYKKGKYISIRHIDNYLNIIFGNPPENCAMVGVCSRYYVVEANGDLYPCDFFCREEYKIGSLSDIKPFEINEKQKEFINKSFLIHENCKGCKYYLLCRGGCRKDRSADLKSNKYCSAYKGFFDYSIDRMIIIAEEIRND